MAEPAVGGSVTQSETTVSVDVVTEVTGKGPVVEAPPTQADGAASGPAAQTRAKARKANVEKEIVDEPKKGPAKRRGPKDGPAKPSKKKKGAAPSKSKQKKDGDDAGPSSKRSKSKASDVELYGIDDPDGADRPDMTQVSTCEALIVAFTHCSRCFACGRKAGCGSIE